MYAALQDEHGTDRGCLGKMGLIVGGHAGDILSTYTRTAAGEHPDQQEGVE